MRKVVLSEFITLDGVIENPRWTLQFFSDEAGKFKLDELFASDMLLLGRVTYEGFAEAWPTMTDEQGFADRMNSLPKAVATRTLTDLTWNATPLGDDVVAEVKNLKEEDGDGDILIGGSGKFARTLMEADLIDEYRLMVYPIVLGYGQRLFTSDLEKKLKLDRTVSLPNGVMVLSYSPTLGAPESNETATNGASVRVQNVTNSSRQP